MGTCAAKAIFYCPTMNSHRPRSQNTAKEQALIPENQKTISRWKNEPNQTSSLTSLHSRPTFLATIFGSQWHRTRHLYWISDRPFICCVPWYELLSTPDSSYMEFLFKLKSVMASSRAITLGHPCRLTGWKLPQQHEKAHC